MPLWFRLLYSLLWIAALPVVLARLLWRSRRNPDYRKHWSERLTFDLPNPHLGHFDVWLHAVSVGEARAAAPLVRHFARRNQRIIITCTTPTGRATCAELYANQAQIAYLPFDAPFLMRRFLRAAKPKLGLLMETELWPGTCDAAKALGVPMWLINARLSERSARGYGRAGSLTRSMLACLDGVAAQTRAHADRFGAIGAQNVHVVGNLKFDLSLPSELQQRADALTELMTGGHAARPYWVAGATRQGEEVALLKALKVHPLREAALAVIVPRHPERWAEVVEASRKLGFRTARRSDPIIAADTEVLIGDSMGELLIYYANAKACVMGGTFAGTGGQNLIEPCSVGVPVALGPSVFNFQQAADEAIAAGAAIRVPDARGGVDAVYEWLHDESWRKLASVRARAFVAQHRGATERTLALLQ
ncbi:MAG: 3-deoxy-D-manno-octulosonic acid transferase [Betaproteobacteria bacterium]|nr:MAG: 3-deoxy-D-manno-octulosonic acid transferase [Betaproteobacteria bacterium]